MLLPEVHLEVGRVVVVPVFLSVDRVSNTEEQCLGSQVGGIGKLDGEREAVLTKRCLLGSNLVTILSGDL